MKINEKMLLGVEELKSNEETSEIDIILEYEEILLAVSETMINYRKKYNLTQNQLAKLIGIKQEMISKLESGYYNPTLKLLHKISRKLSNSSDIFIEFLENIKNNIEKLNIINYEIDFENKKYQCDNLEESKNNIIYCDFNSEKSNNKESGYYEKEYYTSSVSNGRQCDKGVFFSLSKKDTARRKAGAKW